MKIDPNNRYLVIPDVHQNYAFLDSVLEREPPEQFAGIVFLGDFFDAKKPQFIGIDALKETLNRVARLIVEYGEKVEILLGNHDVLYYYMQDFGKTSPLDKAIVMDYYGMPDRDTLTLCSNQTYRDFWQRFRIATLRQNHLLSHAGVTLKHWDSDRDSEANLSSLNDNIGRVRTGRSEIRPFFRAGQTRGGDLPRGGPLWLDWNLEFEDELSLPQIVGHTAGSTWRKNGRSYCLDGIQSCYAVLDSDGVHPRTLEEQSEIPRLF